MSADATIRRSWCGVPRLCAHADERVRRADRTHAKQNWPCALPRRAWTSAEGGHEHITGSALEVRPRNASRIKSRLHGRRLESPHKIHGSGAVARTVGGGRHFERKTAEHRQEQRGSSRPGTRQDVCEKRAGA